MLFFLALLALASASPFQNLPLNSSILSLSPIDYATIRLLLFVEHLETYIYRQGCSRFTADDFPTGVYEKLCQIGNEKEAVVENFRSLLDAAGEPPVIAGCDYFVAFIGPYWWADVVNEIGAVGVGAYLGAIEVVQDNSLLQQLIANIATTEARHDTYLRTALGATPAPSIYDTPIPPTWSYSLIQKWIQSCPEPLGYPIFPKLGIQSDLVWRSGTKGRNLTIDLSWNPDEFSVEIPPKQPLYLALVYNIPGDRPILLPVQKTDVNGTGNAVIPGGLTTGVAFAALTTFVELDTVGDLVQYGTLAGPTEILMS